MAEKVKVAAIFYSSTGNTYRLMKAAAEGAEEAGAEVRLHIVPELAPPEAIARNPKWQKFRDETAASLLEAALDDLEWADAYIFGSPTRFGNIAAQLKQFMDTAGGLWSQGKLANKMVAGITSASNPNGGQESTLLALYNTMYHWGAIIVPPGYTAPLPMNRAATPTAPPARANPPKPTWARQGTWASVSPSSRATCMSAGKNWRGCRVYNPARANKNRTLAKRPVYSLTCW